MEMVNIKINGRDYSVPADSKIIDAARIAKIEIPTLCYLKGISHRKVSERVCSYYLCCLLDAVLTGNEVFS